MALTRATKEAVWLQRLIGELTQKRVGPVTINVDNQSAIALAKNPEAHDRTKHIDIQYHFIRHQVGLKRVKLLYCPTEEMLADILTKSLPREKHVRAVQGMQLMAREGEDSTTKQDIAS
jgi:hypothetical protein